jgi:hypothetical protein
VGPLHPSGLFSLGTGNLLGDARLADPANGDFRLAGDSPARGAGVFGDDLGADVPGGARVTGEPPVMTASTSAMLTVGGPGVFHFKWKLDNGPWSAATPIDPANPLTFPRNGPTVRTASLQLDGLAPGPHVVSVIGQDFAGVWQDEAAATVSRAWTVVPGLAKIMLSELVADAGAGPDVIEIHNAGAAAVDLGGHSLTDDPLAPAMFPIPPGTSVAPGGFWSVPSTLSGIALDRDGDEVFLFQGPTLIDSIRFGPQVRALSLAADRRTGCGRSATRPRTRPTSRSSSVTRTPWSSASGWPRPGFASPMTSSNSTIRAACRWRSAACG